ncbi:uncharacterized protein LOC143553027 [Bidens hawaiensis]|uniref:uncharacterized protein LOC143553027 n=1 Tax=Bidens hawaiensis TaxID=980011 RepID=UPI00404A56B1
MALVRINNRLTSSTVTTAPPPSPVPNSAKSARGDQAFGSYLDKMKHMPDNLPDYVNRSMIADVEYRLIKIQDKNSISEMKRSAKKYGVFRISGHRISTEELQQAFSEAEFCFGLLADRWSRDGDREEFQWSRSGLAAAERRCDVAREERFRKFSQKMDNLASKLEAIADEAAKIVGSYGTRTGPDTIVFTLGEQMQEWSCGEYKGASGEINIEPEITEDHEPGSYSVELKCSPPVLNQAVDRINTWSITDQLFIVLGLLLFSLLSYFFL